MYHLYIRKVYSNAIINIPSQRPENSGLGLRNRGFLGALPQKASDGSCPSSPMSVLSHPQGQGDHTRRQPSPHPQALLSHHTVDSLPHSQRSTASMADPREDDRKGRHSLAGLVRASKDPDGGEACIAEGVMQDLQRISLLASQRSGSLLKESWTPLFLYESLKKVKVLVAESGLILL